MSAPKKMRIKTEHVRSGVVERRKTALANLSELAFRTLHYRAAEKQAKQQAKDTQAEALNAWQAAGITGDSVTLDNPNGADSQAQVTRVAPIRSSLDHDKLRNEIGAAAYRKLCSEQIDQTKIQRAVQDGSLPASTLAKCMTEEPTAPYLKITYAPTDTTSGKGQNP